MGRRLLVWAIPGSLSRKKNGKELYPQLKIPRRECTKEKVFVVIH